ncbi:MAG: hypothetical protein M1438_03850 [Deltaproteobacteria bacterium]|nr:hypothetical protein [Deltaproteobacteria bacterium]
MKNLRYLLWAALLALALSGALLHLRIHPPGKFPYAIWPNLFSWTAVLLVCPLFLFRYTAVLAVVLNSFIAYIGIILMADFSINATLTGQIKVMPGVDFFGWLLQATFSDITVLIGHLMVGLALYRVIMTEQVSSKQ